MASLMAANGGPAPMLPVGPAAGENKNGSRSTLFSGIHNVHKCVGMKYDGLTGASCVQIEQFIEKTII